MAAGNVSLDSLARRIVEVASMLLLFDFAWRTFQGTPIFWVTIFVILAKMLPLSGAQVKRAVALLLSELGGSLK